MRALRRGVDFAQRGWETLPRLNRMAQLDYMAIARPASGRPIVLAVLVVLT
jgi:hypothetical protein